MSVKRIAAAVVFFASIAASHAGWNLLPLPNLAFQYGGTALSHLPDGRYVFAQNGNMYLQNAWGVAGDTEFVGEPVPLDPSFISVLDADTAAAGAGGFFGASGLYQFDPSSPATPLFAGIGSAVQNYYGVYRGEGALFTGGADTGPGGNAHGIRYIAVDGSINTVVVDNVSVYSTGFATDKYGNLYVGDNDDGKVYKFTSAQIDSAIWGTALTTADGELIYDFGGGGDIGSLAVDTLGRIWASGWQHAGIYCYHPVYQIHFTYYPAESNANYKVTSFIREGEPYVSVMNQTAPYLNDSLQTYGYARASDVANPTPPAVYDRTTGNWSIRHPSAPVPVVLNDNWGSSELVPVYGDYDGNGAPDLAAYHPATGRWYIRSLDSSAPPILFSKLWGGEGFTPVSGDYDGDGVDDLAVYHSTDGRWQITSLVPGRMPIAVGLTWGGQNMIPVPGDYDNDGRDDLAVYNTQTGEWFIRSVADGPPILFGEQWGGAGMTPVAGDYNNDGADDLAAYEETTGAWFVKSLQPGALPILFAEQWGGPGMTSVSGDFDADGTDDLAVYQEATGNWFVRHVDGAKAPIFFGENWGGPTMTPVGR